MSFLDELNALYPEEDDEELTNQQFLDSRTTTPTEEPLSIDEIIAAPSAPAVSSPATKVGQTQVLPGLKNDLVRQHILELAQKKQAGDRAKLVQDVQDTDSSILGNLFAGISGFGAGIAKRDVGQAFNQAKAVQMAGPNRALAEFDKAREQGLETEDRNLQRTRLSKEDARADKREGREDASYVAGQQLAKDKLDPNSRISKIAQGVMAEYNTDLTPEELSKLTAADVEARGPATKFRIENTYKREVEQAKRDQHKADKEQQAEQFNKTDSRIRSEGALGRAAQIEAAKITAGQKTVEGSKLSDPQTKELSDRTVALDKVKEVAATAKAHPEWIGNMAGNAPATSAEEREFRSDVLKAKIAYQYANFGGTTTKAQEKLVDEVFPRVGEISVLSNPIANFQGKMDSAVKDAEKAVETFATTIKTGQNKNNPALSNSAPNAEHGASGSFDEPIEATKPPVTKLPTPKTGTKATNTDPTKGPTAKIPLGAQVRNKTTGKVQVMTATGLK